MGSVGDCFDISVAESFFGTLQLELLDEHEWTSRQHLALAVFEWIEAWYNPKHCHSYCDMLSPDDYEAAHAACSATNQPCPPDRGKLRARLRGVVRELDASEHCVRVARTE